MTRRSFQHQITVPFQDIDAAGIVFFAHLFRYAHETYEQFMSKMGFSLAQILKDEKYRLPLVHAEADYRAPLTHTDNITISLSVERLGTSSFTLAYVFIDEQGHERAVAKTVHVVINAEDNRKLSVPAELERALTHYVI